MVHGCRIRHGLGVPGTVRSRRDARERCDPHTHQSVVILSHGHIRLLLLMTLVDTASYIIVNRSTQMTKLWLYTWEPRTFLRFPAPPHHPAVRTARASFVTRTHRMATAMAMAAHSASHPHEIIRSTPRLHEISGHESVSSVEALEAPPVRLAHRANVSVRVASGTSLPTSPASPNHAAHEISKPSRTRR